MTKDQHTDPIERGRDAAYGITIPEKRRLLMRVYDMYEAGKKQDQKAYYDIRSEILELVYQIQDETASRIQQETERRVREEERTKITIEQNTGDVGCVVMVKCSTTEEAKIIKKKIACIIN